MTRKQSKTVKPPSNAAHTIASQDDLKSLQPAANLIKQISTRAFLTPETVGKRPRGRPRKQPVLPTLQAPTTTAPTPSTPVRPADLDSRALSAELLEQLIPVVSGFLQSLQGSEKPSGINVVAEASAEGGEKVVAPAIAKGSRCSVAQGKAKRPRGRPRKSPITRKAHQDSGDLHWAGGLFDGEGCISLTCTSSRAKHGKPTYTLSVSISQKVFEALAEFEWGVQVKGSSGFQHTPASRQNACGFLKYTGASAVALLKVLEPYLRIKRPQALLALDFADKTTPEWQAIAGDVKAEQKLSDSYLCRIRSRK